MPRCGPLGRVSKHAPHPSRRRYTPPRGEDFSRMALYRAFATVGAMTICSRILGFIRDVLIAAVLGAGPVADAFFVAFRVPNLFRRLFAEGAFDAAFIPLF